MERENLQKRLLKEGKSIYYSDNPNRTLNLSDVIKIIYTDKNQPLRINLEKIIDLRNISTHLVTEDYETVYAPFFQANILNFSEQLQKFHNIDITRKIPQNFLSLTVNTEDEKVTKALNDLYWSKFGQRETKKMKISFILP